MSESELEKLRQDFCEWLPSVEELRNRARKRVPKFAFDYLDGGCNEGVNLQKNTDAIREIELIPNYLESFQDSSIECELFGHRYSAPFGIAPIGLQGLMWPDSCAVLAAAAKRHNIPFVLSTVTTGSIEEIAEATDGKFWFQLYHPAETAMRDDLLRRAKAVGCEVLVVLSDVPTFGYRPQDIRNGLAMPPRMSLRNLWQMMIRPAWSLQTLRKGKPQFKSLLPYMPPKLNMAQLGKFMNDTFDGRLNFERLQELRECWEGKLVVKGVVCERDAEYCIKAGVDGIVVSNHGGRQLDAGESTIVPLARLARKFSNQLTVMMDSGIRGGPDIARSIASGADFTFLGRTFMYGVCALGERGGRHVIAMLKKQLLQVHEQLGCEKVEHLKKHHSNCQN